jgi:hypothetical protein
MSLDKFNTTPSPLQVVEKVNDVIDALDAGSFGGYWAAGESVEVGDIRYVEGRDNVGYVLECVQAGTTGDSAPEISEEDIEPSDPDISNINELAGVLGIAKGGTGATTAELARAKLGLTYATNYEAIVGTDNAKVMTPLRVQSAIKTNSFGTDNVATLFPKNIIGLRNALLESANQTRQFAFRVSADPIWVNLWDTNNEQAFTDGREWTFRITTLTSPNYFTFETKSYYRTPSDATSSTYVGSYYNGQWSSLQKLATKGALSMPSAQAINVSVSFTANSDDIVHVGNIYTAPADGWFKIAIRFSGNKHGEMTLWVEDSDIAVTTCDEASGGERDKNVYLPVAKGQVVGGSYIQLSTILNCKFIYAQSEV